MSDRIRYRVDRATSTRVPCGMNNLLYLGASWREASAAFDRALPGKDAWNRPNACYGVIQSVWDERRGDYITKRSKGL